ncbi:MAG: TIGR00266 family protein [Acidimicrobiales bacterium]
MKVDIRHDPSFAVARAHLGPGEAIRAESGSMMATSEGVEIEARMQGGMMRSVGRGLLGGESLFMTTFTAAHQGGWVDVAASLPGDLAVVDITPESPLFISRGCWLFSATGVDLDTKWGGFKNLFGGEGGFLLRATGRGQCAISSYGAMDVVSLAAGERFVLDTGHLIAYEPTVQFTTRRAAQGRTVQSMKSGEGFVFEFAGPGDVITQSRNPGAFLGVGKRQ